jgi:hypothetical protein
MRLDFFAHREKFLCGARLKGIRQQLFSNTHAPRKKISRASIDEARRAMQSVAVVSNPFDEVTA